MYIADLEEKNVKLSYWIHHYQNFVLVGQGGSGKSEFSLALAGSIPAGGYFLDLDQTKAIFRSRDYQKEIPQFRFESGLSFLDSPTVPAQMKDRILDSKKLILDVPADNKGLVLLGQVAEELRISSSCVFLMLNPYRDSLHVEQSFFQQMDAVEHFLPGLDVFFVANPNMGSQTTRELAQSGFEKVKEILKKRNQAPCFALIDETIGGDGEEWIPIKIHFARSIDSTA